MTKPLDVGRYRAWFSEATPVIAGVASADNAIALWSDWLAELARAHRTREFGERFARFCPAPGAHAQDYYPEELQLCDDLWVFAGINKDTDFFVRVYAQSRSLDVDEYASVGTALSARFGLFSPRGVRWWFVAEQPLPGIDVSHATRLVVSSLPHTSPDPVGLRQVRAPDADFHAAYAAIYERFYAAQPHMRDVVRTETHDALRASARAGGLFAYEVDGELAGVFAAMPGEQPPVRGWCAVEAVLDTPFQGVGLAPRALGEMFSRLSVRQHRAVWATIAGINTPSRRSAARVGMLDAGGWLTLASL
ncbi:MAG: GNAT family protein [Pseudomonadota bacterium]